MTSCKRQLLENVGQSNIKQYFRAKPMFLSLPISIANKNQWLRHGSHQIKNRRVT